MKKTPLLNSDISAIISTLGHFDTIAIGDAGLPIPDETVRIDLALTPGTVSFKATLDAVLLEMKVGEFIVAKESSEDFIKKCELSFKIADGVLPSIKKVSHEQLKDLLKGTKAVIRTGECTPYNNIILVSDVAFFGDK